MKRITTGRSGRTSVRLDQPFWGEAPAPDLKRQALAEAKKLLVLIWQAIRSGPPDRRRNFRHPAVDQEVQVGWWVDEKFAAIHGRLVNISGGGALVILGHRPPRNKRVWLSKNLGESLASVGAEVIGHTPAPSGCYAVRLRFVSTCPTALCEAVVCAQPKAMAGTIGSNTHHQA